MSKTAQRSRQAARAWPEMIDLFNARLADERDLRELGERGPAWHSKAAPSLRATRMAHRRDRVAPKAPSRRKGPADVGGLLLVLGESPADRRAVAYVGAFLGRRRGFRVCVAYVLPEFPSSLLEHGGAGDPQVEDRLSAGLQAERKGWLAEQKRGAQSSIDRATALLRQSGLSSSSLEIRFCGPSVETGVADEILKLARARRCRTVVVARHRRSWLGSLFNVDLRAALARRAERLAIWGIG